MSAVAKSKGSDGFPEKRKKIEAKLSQCWGSFSRIEAPMMGALDHVTLSIYSGNNELLKSALKERIGDDNIEVDSSDIVDLAASYGDSDTISIIASAGLEINTMNALGQSPIFAAMNYQPDPCAMLNSLASNGIDIDKPSRDGVTPLVFSIIVGNVKMANCLVSLGARLDYRVEELSLSEFARKRGHSDLAARIDTVSAQ